MFSDIQIKTVKSIVGIIETGKLGGDPSTLVVLEDGAGITYGKHQCTENSGNLWKLIFQYYCPKENAKFKEEFEYYDRILYKNKEYGTKSALKNDEEFKSLLKAAAQQDPIMVIAQEEMFHTEFFEPALKLSQEFNVKYPLGLLIIYDMFIHSGQTGATKLIKRFDENWIEPEELSAKQELQAADILELNKAWIKDLIEDRHQWLISYTSSSPGHQKVVRTSSYRTASYKRLIEKEAWNLELPLEFILDRSVVGVSNKTFNLTEANI